MHRGRNNQQQQQRGAWQRQQQQHKQAHVAPKRKQHAKHITFINGGNTVHPVKPPPRSERHLYWFEEHDSLVMKPLQFELSPKQRVAISIETAVKFHALAILLPNGVSERNVQPQSLEVCDNSTGDVLDTLDARLRRLVGKQGAGARPNKKKAPAWFSAGTCRVGFCAKVNVPLPSGSYVLRNSGKYPLLISGHARDVERTLL